jgi:Histone-like transcription factor (CBF/NF-Y) and archaeal histone
MSEGHVACAVIYRPHFTFGRQPMEDSEATLPKSTLLKLARELLPADVKVATDTQDLIVKCSNEFVQLLATQANEVRPLSIYNTPARQSMQ